MSQALLTKTPGSPATPAPAKPDWFRERQTQAAAAYETAPAPSSRDEAWRFGDHRAVDFSDSVPARPVSGEIAGTALSQSQRWIPSGPDLVFANDRLIHRRPLENPQPVVLPLAEALESHADLIRDHLMPRALETGSQKFALLHLASMRNGGFVYLPKGCRLSQPLHVCHWLAGSGQTLFPHTLVIADEDSSATIVDWYASADSARHMACAMSDLWLMRGASLEYVSVQQWNRSTASVHSCTTHVGEAASALACNLHFGGSYSRFESASRLLGKGARSEMYGITVADEKQHFDQRTLQEHVSPDTHSNLLFKNALYDSAKTTFSGLIRVDENAQRTDAYQKVRNLLLSDQAEANSLPGLEILADQVRCSHGATTGEVDREELFYLLSRGIPLGTALGLITEGFLGEVLSQLPQAGLRDLLAPLLRARLAAHGRVLPE
jgi:Fe-S cluster assembly protein SufD